MFASIARTSLRTPAPYGGAARRAALFSTSHPTRSAVASSASAPQQAGLIQRMAAATPGGRATLGGIFLAGCALDYELYTMYFGSESKGQQSSANN